MKKYDVTLTGHYEKSITVYAESPEQAAEKVRIILCDVFLITLFLGTASAGLNIGLSELVVQFLFPLCVTSGICFGILCSKYSFSETVAIILCVIWSAVWLFVVLNENVYTMVTIPVWLALLGATILFLILTVCRILKNCNQYLEVSLDEIRT